MAHFYRCCACHKEVEYGDKLRVERWKPKVEFDLCPECAKPIVALTQHIVNSGGAVKVSEVPVLVPLQRMLR